MENVEIQIEPIIKRKPIIKWLSGTPRAIPSLKTTEIAFKIYNRSNVLLNEIRLEEIEITGMGCHFTYANSPDFRVVNLDPGKSSITKYLSVFFPTAGVYWLDMRLILGSAQQRNHIVIPRQTDLKDSSRWSSGRVPGKPLDLCRNMLPIVDLHSIRLTVLTSILAILTAGLILLTIYLIKN